MRNQRMPQIQAIKADRRFDALVKKEMQEHEHLISSHNKEMQSLRDEIRLVLEKCTSISNRNQQELGELKDRVEGHILILKDKLAVQALTIAEQKRAIDSLHGKLNDFHESHASKSDVQKFKADLESKLTDSTFNQILAYQSAQKEFKELLNALKEDVINKHGEAKKMVFEAMVKGEKNFEQASLDKEGIERELIRYKKAMFYIEKKIENLYTLIERINKKGELCHRQG